MAKLWHLPEGAIEAMPTTLTPCKDRVGCELQIPPAVSGVTDRKCISPMPEQKRIYTKIAVRVNPILLTSQSH